MHAFVEAARHACQSGGSKTCMPFVAMLHTFCGNAAKAYSVFSACGEKFCMSAKVTECVRAARRFVHCLH